ncbi:MAG: tetratricopeptide repeat protein [Chloroflexota bacterium]
MSSNTLAKAIQLREQKQYAQAETLLRELLTSNPTDPQVNYHLAWTCDAQGKESDAVPFYKTAITNGLSGEDLRRALLGLLWVSW